MTAIRDADGQLLGYAKVVRDLPARRRLEERERELAVLQEVDKLKGDLLSVISHELRTPLNAVLGFGSVLADELVGPLNDEQPSHIDEIPRSGEHLLGLIDVMLDVSRLQAGRFVLEPDVVDVVDGAELVEEAVRRHAAEAERRGVPLVVVLGARPVRGWGDRECLVQVLGHLIDNAVTFGPSGAPVTVSAERSPAGGSRCRAGKARAHVPLHRADRGELSAARMAPRGVIRAAPRRSAAVVVVVATRREPERGAGAVGLVLGGELVLLAGGAQEDDHRGAASLKGGHRPGGHVELVAPRRELLDRHDLGGMVVVVGIHPRLLSIAAGRRRDGGREAGRARPRARQRV
jgi:hypothetical protein